MMLKLLMFWIFFLLASCTVNDGKQVSEPLTVPEQLSQHEMVFSQFDCPNQYCSNFSITIIGDSYSKKLITPLEKSGEAEIIIKSTMSHQQLTDLEQIIAQLKLSRMKTSIMPGSSDCGSHFSDAESYRFVFNKGQFAQTLEIYAGCNNLPAHFQSLIIWFKNLTLLQSVTF